MRCVWLVLAGCNQLFGLDPTEPARDARLGLVTPHDGNASCPAAPAFDTWIYAPHSIAGFAGFAIHPTFIAADRVIFGYQGKLYESAIDSGATKIASLDLGDGAMLMDASALPGKDLIWFLRLAPAGGGVYYAVREGDVWTQHVADLGLLGYQIQPGAAGMYAGTVRMVVGFQPAFTANMHLVELESNDGLVWHQRNTLPFSDGALYADYDPALSADGCVLVFSRGDQTTRDLYASSRQPDGNFAAPIELATASSPMEDESRPALDPTQTRLWFNRTNAGTLQGTP